MSQPEPPTRTSQPPPRSPFAQWALLALLVGVAALVGWALLDSGEGPDKEPISSADVQSDDASSTSARPAPRAPSAWFDAEEIAFAPIDYDKDRIEAARALLKRGEAPPEELASDTLEAFFNLNRLEASGASEARRRPAETSLHIRTREMYGVAGRDGFLQFLDDTWPRFEDALANVAKAARQSSTPIEKVVANPSEALQKDVGWVGGFVVLARGLDVMKPDGSLDPRLQPAIQILYRYRWFTVMAGNLDPRELLTRPEYEALLSFRLHETRKLPLPQRLRYIHELTTLLRNYPHIASEGVVYAQAGKPQLARVRFVEAAEAEPQLADLMNAWIARLDGAAQTPPDTPR